MLQRLGRVFDLPLKGRFGSSGDAFNVLARAGAQKPTQVEGSPADLIAAPEIGAKEVGELAQTVRPLNARENGLSDCTHALLQGAGSVSPVCPVNDAGSSCFREPT
jgi:hypothetical protein